METKPRFSLGLNAIIGIYWNNTKFSEASIDRDCTSYGYSGKVSYLDFQNVVSRTVRAHKYWERLERGSEHLSAIETLSPPDYCSGDPVLHRSLGAP